MTKTAHGTNSRPRAALAAPLLRLAKQGSRIALVAGAGIALTGFVGSRVYDRIFISEDQGASFISTDMLVLSSPADGQVTFLNRTAKKGEPLLTVLTDDGRQVSVDMTCDCAMMEPLVTEGARVFSGMPLGEMMRLDASVEVTAMLSGDALLNLYKNPRVTVTFTDGEAVPAAIINLPRISGLAASQNNLVAVKLKPDRQLSKAEVGQPVKVSFDSFALFRSSGPSQTVMSKVDLVRHTQSPQVGQP